MSRTLIAPSFLFRFAADLPYKSPLWNAKRGTGLGPEHRLPSLGKLNGQLDFAELRAAWSKEGIGLRLIVTGKQEEPSTNPTRIEASDGLAIWIDTRNSQGIHRASRYCHRFLFLPAGDGRRGGEAYGVMLRINRAKDDPKTFSSQFLPAICKQNEEGYQLDALLPASFLSGFDPNEFSEIGFFYAVSDLELGWNTWFHGPEYPFAEDPSMWGSLSLLPPPSDSKKG